MSKIFLIIVFLFFSQSFSAISDMYDFLTVEILLKVLNASIYLDDKYQILNTNFSLCYSNLLNFATNYSYYKILHPQLFNSNGKGLDDLGKELECINTNLYTEYLFVHIHTNKSLIKSDNGVTDYLGRTYTSFGFCVPTECVSMVNKTLNTMSNSFISIFNKHFIKEINILTQAAYIKDDALYLIIIYSLIIFIAIKIIFGIIAKFLYHNGYEYHGVKLYKEKNKDDIINEEKENESLIEQDFSKNTNNNSNELNLKGEYNPNYDFESYFPWRIRIIKYLDLFNNIITFITKRNRYYNERDINILCSIKFIIMGYVILSEIIRILIELPNTSAFNYDFYKSITMILYKRSTNGLTFWIVLESATFSFKLMKFIKKNLDNHGKNISSKRGQTIFLIKQLFKFFIFFIPKIIIFFLIYLLFYYFFDHYTEYFQAKMTHYYINVEFIKTKVCINDIKYVFFPFMNYKSQLPDEYGQICFPFVYVYSNMFYSSILFMIILIILFYFQYYIIDIIVSFVIFVNLIVSFIINLNNEKVDMNDNGKLLYKFVHFSGENYSIFFPNVFFSIFYFGCLLGLCIYYYSEYNIKLQLSFNKSKNNNFNLSNLSDESLNITSLEKNNSIRSFKNLDIENKDENNFYQPMELCASFIIKLRNTNNIIKFILLFLYLFISLFLSIFVVLLYKWHYKTFKIEIESKFHILYLLYLSEKIINVFLFIFFISLVLVFSKKFKFIKCLRNTLFIPISRAGFFIICTYQSLIYILYCLFQLKIQIGFFMIIDIFTAFYILIIFCCIVFSIIVEFPLRIIIKNLTRDGQKDKNKETLYLIKQFQ